MEYPQPKYPYRSEAYFFQGSDYTIVHAKVCGFWIHEGEIVYKLELLSHPQNTKKTPVTLNLNEEMLYPTAESLKDFILGLYVEPRTDA